MTIKELEHTIHETINNAWGDLYQFYPDFDEKKAYEWIHYWSNGGGFLSTQTTVTEAIEESNQNTRKLIEKITENSYYEIGNALHFYQVIIAMIPECQNNEVK